MGGRSCFARRHHAIAAQTMEPPWLPSGQAVDIRCHRAPQNEQVVSGALPQLHEGPRKVPTARLFCRETELWEVFRPSR